MSSSTTPNKKPDTAETSPNIVRVNISTPQIAKTPTSDEIVAAGRRLSLSDESSGTTAVGIEKVSTKAIANDSGSEDVSDEIQCELDSLREQLQQALDDKAELIEESILDKERIKDQKETIELLTKRIREFEMGRNNLVLPVPSRSRSGTSNNSQIKQLSEDNIQLAREVDRLITERDRLEKKLIDLKIKFANGYLSRQNSGASTDEDEIDNETNIFSTLSVDEKLKRKKGKKVLGLSNNKPSVFSAAKSWFSRKNRSTASSPNRSRMFSKSNEINTEPQGIAV